MQEQCYRMPGSNPPVCGIHNVPLVQKKLPVEMAVSGHQHFVYLMCPTSGFVIRERAATQS